jgi:hypothetical protein
VRESRLVKDRGFSVDGRLVRRRVQLDAAELRTERDFVRRFGERHFYPWLLRSANWVGDVTALSDRPLSSAELMRLAQRRTGLTDFGDRCFGDGLNVLLKSYAEEARAGARRGRAMSRDRASAPRT